MSKIVIQTRKAIRSTKPAQVGHPLGAHADALARDGLDERDGHPAAVHAAATAAR